MSRYDKQFDKCCRDAGCCCCKSQSGAHWSVAARRERSSERERAAGDRVIHGPAASHPVIHTPNSRQQLLAGEAFDTRREPATIKVDTHTIAVRELKIGSRFVLWLGSQCVRAIKRTKYKLFSSTAYTALQVDTTVAFSLDIVSRLLKKVFATSE